MLYLFSGAHQEQTTGFRHPKAYWNRNYLPENQVKHSGVYLKSLSWTLVCWHVCLFVCLMGHPYGDTGPDLGSWWNQTKTKCSRQAKKPTKYAGQVIIKRERNRLEDKRWRKRRQRPLPTNQVDWILLFESRERRFLIQSQLPCTKACNVLMYPQVPNFIGNILDRL